MSLYDRIPNNVKLSEDQRLRRALEKWLPNYPDWWREMGPSDFQEKDVYLRTAISVTQGDTELASVEQQRQLGPQVGDGH